MLLKASADYPVMLPSTIVPQRVVGSGFSWVRHMDYDGKTVLEYRYERPLLPVPPFGDTYEGTMPPADKLVICAYYEQAMALVACGILPRERVYYRGAVSYRNINGTMRGIGDLRHLDASDIEWLESMSPSEVKELIWQAIDYFAPVDDEKEVYA